MTVTANDYLDRRQPWFAEAEQSGRVRYDPATRLVNIYDARLISLPQVIRG